MAKILVIEDEEEICEMLGDYFHSRTDYTLRWATTAEKGLELFMTMDPEVVLLDIRLGQGMNGLQFLEHLQGLGLAGRAIMLTASFDDATMQKALALGASGYITKPFTLEYLENNIRRRVESLLIAAR